MKKLIFIFGLILFNSCTTSTLDEDEDLVSGEDRIVKMEFSTSKLDFDEIRISYFDYNTNTNPLVIHQFSYDAAGQPIPLELTFENYDFRFISGEAYRNNPSTEEISVKIYVDDELVVEDAEKGEDGEYAEIRFNYDIVLMKNI